MNVTNLLLEQKGQLKTELCRGFCMRGAWPSPRASSIQHMGTHISDFGGLYSLLPVLWKKNAVARFTMVKESPNPGELASVPQCAVCCVWDPGIPSLECCACSTVIAAAFLFRHIRKKDVGILATWKVVCMPVNLYLYSISQLLQLLKENQIPVPTQPLMSFVSLHDFTSEILLPETENEDSLLIPMPFLDLACKSKCQLPCPFLWGLRITGTPTVPLLCLASLDLACDRCSIQWQPTHKLACDLSWMWPESSVQLLITSWPISVTTGIVWIQTLRISF